MEAAGRTDGALTAGPFYGYVSGSFVPLSGVSAFEFGRAYRVFARQGGTLRVRGVGRSGTAAVLPGWNFVAPGKDALVSEFAGLAWAWADQRPGLAYHRLPGATSVSAGTPLWLYLAP